MFKNKLFRILLLIALILVSYGIYYTSKYSMKDAVSAEFNKEITNKKVLIATQGSTYKDELLAIVVNQIEYINIQVVDIKNLKLISEDDYDGIVIIHTWEMYKAPSSVYNFLETLNDTSKVFTLGTSGSGDLILSQVDGISSASDIKKVNKDAEKVIRWIEKQY